MISVRSFTCSRSTPTASCLVSTHLQLCGDSAILFLYLYMTWPGPDRFDPKRSLNNTAEEIALIVLLEPSPRLISTTIVAMTASVVAVFGCMQQRPTAVYVHRVRTRSLTSSSPITAVTSWLLPAIARKPLRKASGCWDDDYKKSVLALSPQCLTFVTGITTDLHVSSNTCKRCQHHTRRSAIAACETWNAHSSYWGSVPLGPNFSGIGSSPAKRLIGLLFDGRLIALQLCHWKVLDNQTL